MYYSTSCRSEQYYFPHPTDEETKAPRNMASWGLSDEGHDSSGSFCSGLHMFVLNIQQSPNCMSLLTSSLLFFQVWLKHRCPAPHSIHPRSLTMGPWLDFFLDFFLRQSVALLFCQLFPSFWHYNTCFNHQPSTP